MKITLTIEVDNNNITVTPVEQKDIHTVQEVKQEQEKASEKVQDVNQLEINKNNLDNVVIPTNLKTIGERLPKGKNAVDYNPRTEDYPFNVKDAKKVLKENRVNMTELAREMGNFPAAKLRNIFRYDNRRFTKEEFNVILKAVDNIVKEKEINL